MQQRKGHALGLGHLGKEGAFAFFQAGGIHDDRKPGGQQVLGQIGEVLVSLFGDFRAVQVRANAGFAVVQRSKAVQPLALNI